MSLYTAVIDSGGDIEQHAPPGIGSAVFNTYVTNLVTEIIAGAGIGAYLMDWGAGDLGNAIGGNRVLHAWSDGTNAPFVFTGRDDEGRGQKYMLQAGTFIQMIAAVRGVQPGATDIIWTYTVRVDEADTAVTDNFNIRTTGLRQKITTGLSLHVDAGARVSIRTSTDVASGTVSAPYVSLLFVPDPL